MSIPEWQHKLEIKEFVTGKNPALMIDYILNDPAAANIPEDIKKAKLSRYGYVDPVESKPKSKTSATKSNTTIRGMTDEELHRAVERMEKNKKAKQNDQSN